jgi:hypothetical protein
LQQERSVIPDLIKIIAADERTTVALKLSSWWARTIKAQSSWRLC